MYNKTMKKLITIIVLSAFLTSAFVSGNGDPTRIKIGEEYFTVDTTGIVPDTEGAITQFAPGVFLAHNYLSGKHFTGENVVIEYSSGNKIEYETKEIIILQALPQTDGSTLYSDGVTAYTDADIFLKIFSRGDITFATCYDNGSALSWGRKFIVMKELQNGEFPDKQKNMD